MAKRLKVITSFLKNQAWISGTALVTGAAVGSAYALPGSRTEGAKEGAKIGAGVVALGLASRSRTLRTAATTGARAAGGVIFRRVRGRIIAIRSKIK